MRLKLFNLLLALLAFLALSSCSSDEENVEPIDTTQRIQIKFTIAMSSNSRATKAGTWGDDDYEKQEADYWENTIDLGKIQVLAYTLDNNYLGQLNNATYVRRADSEDNVYDVTGSLFVEDSLITDGKFSCKLVVFANYDNAISERLLVNKTLDNIRSTTYTYNVSGIANRTAYIPMWGIQTYSDDNTEETYKPLRVGKGVYADAGEIFMLRAMAKVRIALADDVAENFKITGATLSDYNTSGFFMPTDYSVNSTKDLTYESTTTPSSFRPRSVQANDTVRFANEVAGQSVYVYVPEYRTSTDSEGMTTPYIAVSIAPRTAGVSAGKYKIALKQYDAGVAKSSGLNLVRNTVYDYTITSVGPTLLLRYQAIDWTAGGGNISFE